MSVDFHKHIEYINIVRDGIIGEVRNSFANIPYPDTLIQVNHKNNNRISKAAIIIIAIGVILCIIGGFNYNNSINSRTIFWIGIAVLSVDCFLLFTKGKRRGVDDDSQIDYQDLAFALNNTVQRIISDAAKSWEEKIEHEISEIKNEILNSNIPFESKNKMFNSSSRIVRLKKPEDNILVTFIQLINKEDILQFKEQVSKYEELLVDTINQSCSQQISIWESNMS